MARLVNKQFNSPIGLYSEQNIREVIERESHNLSNGSVRILEEDEHRQRNSQSPSNGYSRPLRDNIKWPPPGFVQKSLQRSSFKDVVTPGLKRVAWPPPNEGENYIEQAPVQAQGGPQYSYQSPTLQNNYTPAQQVSHSPSQRQPLKPLEISNGTSTPQSTNSPLANQSPLGYRPSPANRQWAPVQPPVAPSGQSVPQPYQPPFSQQYQSPPTQQYQTPPFQQYQSSPSEQYQPQNKTFNQQSPQPSVQSVAATNQIPVRQVQPPPATITLRQQPPINQAPPPVVTSQPATATLKGGKHLRGDLKWPPENVKRQVEEENRQRLELARGPAFRPRLVRKDYGPFFAQHALNSSYPGYRAPPGTQFYENKAVY